MSPLEIALGLRPRAISRASGCKIPALGKSLGPRGVYFPIHPSSRQCTDSIYIIHPLQHVILAKNSSSALPQANASIVWSLLESLFP